MANPNNVELEAAKFLHKLIQESKDEPTKLATKLYVILQHMRSSGKENSMPYQVISRAMETVVKQHGLDIEALMSSRLPMSAAAQLGEAASSQVAGSSQRPGVTRDSKANLLGNEMVKPDAYASSSAVSGPSGSAHGIYQASAPHISGTGVKVPVMAPSASNLSQPVEPGISSPMQFGSPSIDNHGYAAKLHKDGSTEPFSGSTSVDLVAGRTAAGRALEHEGGSSMLGNASKISQGGMPNNVPEKSILRSETIRDAGKLPVAAQAPVSAMPFKEHHLKQLRAQCLVFLAFRNGLMPKKLHLEIALGNFYPKEDRRELVDHKGREQLVTDQGSASEVTRTFGGAGETDRLSSGPTPSGILADTNSSMEAENANLMEDKNGQLDPSEHADERRPQRKMRMIQDAEVPIQDATESQASALRGVPNDSKSLPPYNHEHAPAYTEQLGMFPQASSVMGSSKQMKPDLSGWSGTEASKVSPPASANTHESGPLMKDNHTGQSQNLVDSNIQGHRHADSNLPSLPLRQQWKSVPGVINQSPAMMQVKDSIMLKNQLQVQETDQEDENISGSMDRLPSPRHTMMEKWILDRQKRKLISEQKWSKKQQKTEERIAACAEKLKESVSSSEDISAKTKSVIELKKLQLLELQRRLRSEILNDFFKPIATDMERLKSIKKHRIGRKSKQLERYEQRMKEERQKRIRERQKEFFSEIEVHRERLEDVFKMKRERWKGFNKYVKEFHKRKERIHREKIDRIQREKINLLKINDVEGYLRMVQDAKSDRVKQLLKETEKYLQKLGSKLKEAKSIARKFETDMGDNRNSGVVEEDEIDFGDEDETDQAKHYLESNEKYYMMAHSIKETIAEQPSSLKGGKLREYQMNGLRWLVSLYNNHLNGILADEMGLGKTVQVISLMCYLMETKNDRGPFLVVVPSSVLPGWESEINFWAPDMLKIVYSGPPEERRKLFKERIVHQKFNVLLTTYEYLMNKHDRPKLSKVHWHYIIIDEGHRIKNASCKLNADLKHYRSNHRLLLTGTPLQNNLEELWALLNFLLPNIFNSSEDFSQWFNKPFESGDNSPDEALLSEEENLLIINRLHQVLRPFVLRRLKHKVENELPEKIERLVRCEASSYQKLLMKRVEDNLGAFGTSKARSVHNSVMELRNICNHPYLSQLHVEEVHELIPKHYLPTIVRLCGKLEMLDRLLPKLKATDHRVLLFSTMTRLLDVMEDYLCWKQYKYLRLDGHTSGGDRGALIDKFNQPNSPFFIFLLSIRAGGVGVNLQAADTVIIFDTDWNPQVDLQAQARAHRIGQKKDVLVLRLETVQTVEEQVRAAAEHKLGVANQSITAGFFDNNTSAEDRREYLESLLRESKKEEAAPVLDDDSLNDLIARSEPEIDIFESVDRRRREEEMEIWKKLCSESGTQSSELIPPLPSRLLTDDDLKPFYEEMKISDKPVVAPNPGLKRKGESLGGLDIQHYGRGKRAREVRSYEEQWTEEEFEKMCLAESPQSPSLREEIQEKNFPPVSGTCPAPVVAISEIQTPAPYQPPPQQPMQELPQQPVQELPQQLVRPIVQQGPVTVTPPSKRGRGRPRRIAIVTEISPSPVVISAIAASVKVDSNTIAENTSTSQATSGPVSVSLPCASSVESTSAIILQNVTGGAPSYQSNIPSVAVASQSGPPCPPTNGQGRGRGRGRGRKPQTGGEAPGRRGKRQNVTAEAFPTLPTQAVNEPVSAAQGVNVMSSSSHHMPPTPPAVGKPDLVPQVVASLGSKNFGHAPASARDARKELNSVVPLAASSTSKELIPVSTVSVIPSSSASQDPSSISPAPVLQSSSRNHSEDHLSLSAAQTEATLQANAISVVPHSSPSAGKEPSPVSPVPLHSSASKDSNSVLPAPVPASSSACVELSSVCPVPAVASSSSSIGHDSVCDSSNLKSIGQQESGVVTAHTSDPVPPLPTISSVSQYSTPPTAPKPGRGRGRKPQTGSEAPRRRGKRQDLVTGAVTEGLGAQDPRLIEPPQKRTRLSVGRKPTTRSKRENETQQVVDHSVASQKTPDFAGGQIPKNMVFSEVNPQNNAINRDASQSHAILVPSQVGDNVNRDFATAEEVLSDAQQKATVVQSVTSQSCSGTHVEPQINTVNSDNSPAQEVQEQTVIVQSDASQKIPYPGAGQIPQAMACCEVELRSNSIKSDPSQASSGDVASCEAATTKEVLSEDQQTMKVQSAASQTPSVHSVGKMPEDIVSNEVQLQGDAIRTDASQSHVTLASSGSMAPITDCLVEKSGGDSKGEGIEKTETNSKDGSNMEVPIGALELTLSGNLNKSGDAEGQASSTLNGVLPTSSELVPCPSIKAEVYLGSEGSGKVGFNLGSTQSLSESVAAKTNVEQLQTEDLSLDKSFVSKAEAASIEHLAGGRLRKELETGDTVEEETVVSPAVGTDNQNMKGITSFASPSTEAEALVDEPPLCRSYKPAKDKLEVAAEGTHSDKVAMAEVCEQDKLSVNASLEITKDLRRVEKEKFRIPETFEKQVNVADSLTEKCGSDLAAQGPDMKDSDVSEVVPSPRNESQSSFTVGTSQSEPERQAIAEANLDPETFPSTESDAQKESLSPRLASNAEAVEALTETFASHHDTNFVAELQGNLSFDVKDDLSNSEANVSQLCPAAGSSENHPELKQVVVEDMRTKICEESASDEVDDIVPRQTEKADGQCCDDLSVETHERKRSKDNVDVLNGELNKPLSSTIVGTSKKVADLELVAEENTGRINDGSVDSGQVAEKSEDMAIRDLTVEGQESKGTDAAGDTSTSKNEVESQSSVIESIEKMYYKPVASGEVPAAELLIERSEHLHVLDHAIEVQGNKGSDATRYVSKSNSELNEAHPGGTSQIGTELQLVAEEDLETMNKENTLPDATAVKPQPAISENLSIRDPAQGPKNQRSDATEDFATLNVELNESQPKVADGSYEIVVESHLVSKQNMEIHVEVATGNVTAENAAVGKSENFPLIDVAVEEKGKKESDVTDEISNSELSEPKTSQSAIEVETHLICEESGMTDKEVAPLEVEVVEIPFRDLPGCSGRDLAVEGQEKEKSAASKNVSNPENEEPKCSPGARAADNGAESQLVAERNSETVLTKEVFSGKEENSSIKPAGDEDVPTATEYGDQELSSATEAGDDKTVSTAITDA